MMGILASNRSVRQTLLSTKPFVRRSPTSLDLRLGLATDIVIKSKIKISATRRNEAGPENFF